MSMANVSLATGKKSESDVIAIIADALDVPATKLNPNTKSADIGEWDSMGILSILSSLDREGIKLDIGDAESLQSVKGVLEVFQSAGKLE